MVDTIYANAYKEVLVVISNLKEEDYNKIPENYIEFFKYNCNNDYEFEYNTSKPFYEQKLLKETKYILFGLFEKFWATDQQKAKINTFKINFNNKLEEQRREKYNLDNLFKSKTIENKMETNNVSMIKYKENIFNKIWRNIKNVFCLNRKGKN